MYMYQTDRQRPRCSTYQTDSDDHDAQHIRQTINDHDAQHIRQTVSDHDAQHIRQTDNDHDAQHIRQTDIRSKHAVHTGHPVHIELDRIQFERVHTECTFAQSNFDPDEGDGYPLAN